MVTVRPATGAEGPIVREILTEAQLPTDDFRDGDVEFFVAEEDGMVVGTIGLETYGESGLLRSAAVRPSHRSRKVGALLVEALIREARARPLRELVLLTTTAAGFFRKMGFSAVPRASMAERVLASAQFAGTRCSSATVMRTSLR